MKRISISNLVKISNLTIPPISYKSAFGISVLIHLLVFLLLAFLINPIEAPHSSEIPLVIDFVSMPGIEDQQITNNTEIENNNQVLLSNNFTNPVPQSIRSRDAIVNNKIKSLPSDQYENPDAEFNDPGDIPERIEHSKFSQTNFASVLIPPSLKLPRFDIAEPGLVPAKMPMSKRHETTLLKNINKLAEKFHKMQWSDTSLTLQDRKQKFELQIRHQPAKNSTGLDELVFDVTTKKNGKILSTQMRMRRLAFSNFAQLVDYWDPQVAVHNDEFEGRFHTNYAFSISRSKGIGPKFHGKVTTAAVEVKQQGEFPIIDEEAIFIGGIETGVNEIRLPKTFSLFAEQSKLTGDNVHHITGETWITFNKDGSYFWKTTPSSANENFKNMPGEPFFIIGDKRAKIHVKGNVKGKVLVYSADDIIIDDDLRYTHPPDKFPNSDDYLGLVSEKNVEIAHPAITGAGDLHINAAMYAKQWFRVPNLYGSDEATLYIYGSLSAGSLTATEPRYATHIYFDKRLETQRPPNFPMTERYELVDWEKEWKVNKN